MERTLKAGDRRFLDLLPGVARSPALARIAPDRERRKRLLEEARVLICGHRGYAFVDVEAPAIVLSEWYWRTGEPLDLYLDLLHELTHLRQREEGFDLWDERFSYVDRPTEVEAYAVAVEEGRRLGMTEEDVLGHLTNPWMSQAEVRRLLRHVDAFLGGGPLPNLAKAKNGAPFLVRHPWRCPRREESDAARQAGPRGVWTGRHRQARTRPNPELVPKVGSGRERRGRFP
ncbi:MAG TPA: hypothetical protein VGK67_30650 [Myxococcales bacterium]